MDHIYQNINTDEIINEKKEAITDSLSRLITLSLHDKNIQERNENPYEYYETTLQQDPEYTNTINQYEEDIQPVMEQGGTYRELTRENKTKYSNWGLNWYQGGGEEQNNYSDNYSMYQDEYNRVNKNNKGFLNGMKSLGSITDLYKRYDNFHRDPNAIYRNKGINKKTYDNYNLNDKQKEYLEKVVKENKYFNKEAYDTIAQELGKLGPVNFSDENGVRDLLKSSRRNWALIGDIAEGALGLRKPEGTDIDFRNLSISNFADVSSPYLGDIPVNFQGSINNEENIQNIII